MISQEYFELGDEGTWIDYLRARLPYSFLHIERGKNGRYVVSEPVLHSDQELAETHNFWRRGNVNYMTGKLLDYYSMSDVGETLRFLEVLRLETPGDGGLRRPWPIDVYTFYNSMQMEKVWRHAQENHLDRERLMLLNVTQAVELCLKAVSAHSSYRETGCFMFSHGHNVPELYDALPQSLREEFAAESKSFAKEYVNFRTQVESDIKEVQAKWKEKIFSPKFEPQLRAIWYPLAKRIKESNYTAFVGSNDPGESDAELHEDWFEKTMNRMRSSGKEGEMSVYFRYAPRKHKDELPVDLVHNVLLLGRFLYEHLFPVPLSGTRPFIKAPNWG